jgi:MscS family membrane protein
MVPAMDGAEQVLEFEIGGITPTMMAIALIAIAVGFGLARLVEVAFGRMAAKAPPASLRHAALTAGDRPLGWTFRVVSLWIALGAMPLERVEGFDMVRLVDALMLAATVVLATWLGTRLVEGLTQIWAERAAKTHGTFDDQLVPIVRKAAKVFLVVIGAVMVIQNLGYSVASLLAGIGLGGAALAFASKDTVANFFGSIVIFVDRPFQIGDWVEVGEVEGTVEEVGIRVTTIRTFANSVITIPNAQFTTTAINNWSRMKKRRITLTVGLTYDATPGDLRQAVDAIRAIIRHDERLDQDFFLVNFHDFGPSSLDIFCYLFTRTTNWADHMQIREDFMLEVMEAMQNLHLSFAFPTQTLHLEGLGAAAAANQQPPGAPKAMLRDRPR